MHTKIFVTLQMTIILWYSNIDYTCEAFDQNFDKGIVNGEKYNDESKELTT